MNDSRSFFVSIKDRNPDEWVVLGSGPNSDGWKKYASEKCANIFCVNGSIMLCSNPTSYLSTDPAAIRLFAGTRKGIPAETELILGFDDLVKVTGTSNVEGLVVRSVGMWALYLACKIKKAKTVALFGIHGANNEGRWPTLSRIEGQHNSLSDGDFDTYVKKFDSASPDDVKTALLEPSRPTHANFNTALLIKKMRLLFPETLILLMGNGPVADLLNSDHPLGLGA